jgi:integrase
MSEAQARTALDDIVAQLNRSHSQVFGSELVRRFVEQVYIPQKYENGDWRRLTGQEAEYLFQGTILPAIGEMRCRDLKAENLRAVLRKMAQSGRCYGSVGKVRLAMKDMIAMMVAEQYLASNIAEGVKTPKTAKRSDRSQLNRVSLTEYAKAWAVLAERERLAFDLVLFCGFRESEVYGLKQCDFVQRGALRIERSWFKGQVEPPKNNRPRVVGIDFEIFDRLEQWVGTLPDRAPDAWVFPSERIITPLLPDNVLRRCIYPRLEPIELDWINFAVLRRSHSSLHQERGTDPKIIADQQGHGLDVHMTDYVDSHIALKREATSALWSDFKALEAV